MIDDSELSGLRLSRENDDFAFDIVKPFGPSILETTLPPDILEKMLALSDYILGRSDRESWGPYLVGQIREEPHVPEEVFAEYGVLDYLKNVYAEFSFGCVYANASPGYKREVDKLVASGEFRNPVKIDIESGWIVSQQPGEYNPIHNHSMATIASVIYLKVPEDMQGTSIPGKQNTDGCIEFVDRAVGDSLVNLQTSTVRVKPKTGQFYVFPSSLLHLVYPYQNASERRSLAINATHRF